jgi:hypothetical protein
MSTVTLNTPNRSNLRTSRKDTTDMFAIDLRLAEAIRHQDRLRAARDADRRAWQRARSFRHRLGASIIAIGRRIGGDAVTTPAWQG